MSSGPTLKAVDSLTEGKNHQIAMDLSYLKKKKILVVDDFANVRKSVRGQLMDLGIEQVWEAASPDKATNAVRETRFDLILCDYNLGKGRDGARLLEEWRTRRMMGPDTIFVLITAETARDVVISALEFQPDDYLAKPFTMEVLENRLHRWFERRNTLMPMTVSMEKQDWAAVAQSAKEIIENHPRYRSIGQKAYAEALIQQQDYTAAEHFLLGVLDKRYQSWAQTQLHRLDVLQKKYQAAEVGLVAVLTRDPNLMEGYELLIDALLAQNKLEEAQSWLESAVLRSPKNIQRQRKLVLLAQNNQDFRRASQASRDVMSMSAGTMHETIGNYFAYLRTLRQEADAADADERRREINREITSVTRKINERFPQDINARFYSKALAIMNDRHNDTLKHEKTLDTLYTEVFENVDLVEQETALLLAETYYQVDRLSDADSLVAQFRKRFSDQPDVIRRLDELQVEPVSMASRKEAKQLNLKGIELYKSKDYAGSIRFFEDAMKLSPRHPGIILNLVQSHLLRMKADGVDSDDVAECLDVVRRLEYLPEDHYQYERYTKLRSNLESLN